MPIGRPIATQETDRGQAIAQGNAGNFNAAGEITACFASRSLRNLS
jgi:hypothetical protein